MAERIRLVVEQQPDMLFVGQVDNHVDLLLMAGTNVHVVVLGASHVRPPPGICSHLLSENPDLKILVVEKEGTEVAIYWLGLRQQLARMEAPDRLVSLIRQAYATTPAL